MKKQIIEEVKRLQEIMGVKKELHSCDQIMSVESGPSGKKSSNPVTLRANKK